MKTYSVKVGGEWTEVYAASESEAFDIAIDMAIEVGVEPTFDAIPSVREGAMEELELW